MSVDVLERDLGAEILAPGTIAQDWPLGANVTAMCRTAAGVAAGLGDGRVVVLDGNGAAAEVARHASAVTGVAAGAQGALFSAGQDGKLVRDGAEVLSEPCWLTHLCPAAGGVALAAERRLLVVGEAGLSGVFADHPSAITGIAVAPAGDRIAVSHYDGLSIWHTAAIARPERLRWKGSMTAVFWSPDGRYLVGATQDRELHIWDLVSGRDFRLGGFQAKVRQIGWTADASHMVTSGADVIAAWPLAGDPGAFPPREIGYVSAATVTAVAAEASPERIVGGFSNGTVLVGEVHKGEALVARIGTGGAVKAVIAGGPDIWFGTADGIVGRIALPATAV